ncbi:hypothetical protein [Senegalia massiliensis]|uniref:hypothetical protein n=1 Tax=Senegalia massiliensis TaxID=1720316 RepID=UPI0013624D00|nr:hypothetical protein [Senegalia massiliensis]
MSNIKYLRKFIMLESATSNTHIKGHSKIEVRDGRGKLEVNISGIADVNNVYDIILIDDNSSKKEFLYFGTMSDVGGGKSFYKNDFNPKNVLHSDRAIDDYNIIVIKSSDSEVLYGYIHRKEKEKDILSIVSRKYEEPKEEIEIEEVKEEPKEEIEIEEVEEEPKEEIEIEEVEEEPKEEIEIEEVEEEPKEEIEIEEVEEEPKEEIEIEEVEEEPKEEIEIKEVEEEPKEEIEFEEVEEGQEKEIEVKEIEREQETQGIELNYDDDDIHDEDYPNADSNLEEYILNKSERDLEEYYRYKEYKSKEVNNQKKYNNKTTNNRNKNKYQAYSLNILNYFNQVEPFKINLEEYNFWEITEDSVNIRRGFLPYYNYVVNMQYPYTLMNKMNSPSKQIRKYKHYLFGIVSYGESTVKHFVYGIPGLFTRKEQPFRGMSGFTTWLESKDSGDERLGYWLIHIDAKTGRIITPLRPTSPLS